MYCRKIIDTDNLKNVCNIYLEEENIQLSPADFIEYITKVKAVYQKMLDRGSYTFGCFSNNDELIGVINVNKILDYYPKYENAPYVHLETFIVAKAHQNKGVGTFLLRQVLEKIKTEGCTYVIVQSNNEYVQKIAQKVGLSSSAYDMRCDFVKKTPGTVNWVSVK